MIVFHRIVDVEADRQHRDDAVGEVEQLAVGSLPRQRRAVQDDEVVAPGFARQCDALTDGFGRRGIVPLADGRMEIPFAVVIVRDALPPIESQPKRPGSLLPSRATLLESL